MSGAGLGGTVGGLAGAALAPETGGLSLAIPALLGAGGGFLGGKLTGSKNPLMDAFLGGVGGGLSGASGLGSSLGIGNVGGIGDSIASELPSTLGGTAGVDAASTALAGGQEALSPALAQALGGANTGSAATDSLVNKFAAEQAADSAPASSGIAGYLGRQNPLNLALAGGAALSGVQSLLPHKKVDVNQNRANVLAGNPGFSDPSLPKYGMQNTATPYTGDWYKYGETPQTPLYNAQPQRLAHGGMVKGYAAGGMPMMPQGAPAMPPQSFAMPVNPLALKAAHNTGVEVGKHLKNAIKTPNGRVHGQGGGHDDAVPAKLSQGEYVLSADIPSMLGDGSTDEGAKILDKFVKNVRTHKTSKGGKFPPKAKAPLAYLPKKAKV